MAEGIRISQLSSITSLSNDDVLIINDGDSQTRKISFLDFKSSIVLDVAPVTSVQNKSGDVVLTPGEVGAYSIAEVDGLVAAKASNILLGVNNGDADMGTFSGNILGDNLAVRSLLVQLEAAIVAGDSGGADLDGDNQFSGTNTFTGPIVGAQVGNVIPFYYDTLLDLQAVNAATYHGAVGHAHDTGKLYYAHGGAWVELANQSALDAIDTLDVNLNEPQGNVYNLTRVSRYDLVADGVYTTQKDVNQLFADFIVDLDSRIFSGSYNDLTDVPTAPAPPNDGKLSIADSDGNVIGEFTADSSSDVTITLPAASGSSFDGDYNNLTNAPTLGTASAQDVEYFASAAQGTKADSALQDASAFATAEQGGKADSAVQPADIGTAAAQDVGYFATAAQGTKADSALQDASAFATASQGATADSAVQPSASAITVTSLATDGSESVDSLAAAINTLTAELAAILNT